MDPDFKIYKGFCSCGESYTGEIVTNVKVHLDEHNNPTKVSNPSKHINDNVDHTFHWSVLAKRSKKYNSAESAAGIYCLREAYT